MRRTLSSLHRWTGLFLLLYVVVICLTGSVLVYRNELFALFMPEQGADRGAPLPLGYHAVVFLLELHGDLTQGRVGRLVNGGLALALLLMSVTGVLLWRPLGRGIAAPAGINAYRLHSTIGIGVAVFLVMWAVTGANLSFPEVAPAVVDYLQPLDENATEERLGDRITYWLAYLHFGRFGGRLSWCARASTCHEALRLLWAVAALLPVVLAWTGFQMWRRRRRVTGSTGTPTRR